MKRPCFIFLYILSLLSFALHDVNAGWSMPEEVIFPPSAPFNSTQSNIATGGNGNSVAIWYDVSDTETGIGILRGAVLPAGSVNNLGQPAWILTSQIAAGVQDPFDPVDQALGMDAAGNALVAWTDGNNNIFVSKLLAGQLTWTTPQIINVQLGSEIVQPPYVAVAPNGDAIVLWASSPYNYNYHLLSNTYDAQTNSWKGQVELLGGGLIQDSNINQVAIDANGNGVAVVSTPDNNVQAMAYHFASNSWTTIPPIITAPNDLGVTVAVDHAGNATLVWIDSTTGNVNAATLPFNQTTFTNQQQLSLSAAIEFPVVHTNAAGNALAIWSNDSGAISSARFSVSTGIWTALPDLDLGGNIASDLDLSVDAQGNAVAVWTISLDSGRFIQAASLGVTDSAWNLLTTLSAVDQNRFAHVVLTSRGDGVAIWEDDINDNSITGTIDSSIFLGMFSEVPLPPTGFVGVVIKNKFLNRTDRIHHLVWDASVDPTVVSYDLFRNGVLLSTFAAGSPSYVFEEHFRHKNRVDTYTLTSVNVSGVQSIPVIIMLK